MVKYKRTEKSKKIKRISEEYTKSNSIKGNKM